MKDEISDAQILQTKFSLNLYSFLQYAKAIILDWEGESVVTIHNDNVVLKRNEFIQCSLRERTCIIVLQNLKFHCFLFKLLTEMY